MEFENFNVLPIKSKRTGYHTTTNYVIYGILFEPHMNTYTHCINGCREGLEQSWFSTNFDKPSLRYEKGMKAAECYHKNDLLEGKSLSWHENWELECEDYFKNGMHDGLSVRWHENGKPDREDHYRDGVKDGLSIRWRPNGEEKSRILYKNGVQVK